MEFCLPHLMSKDEVLRILTERQLNIPNIEDLPYEELMRIYTTFAVPLVKRESRSHCSTRESVINVQDTQNGCTPERGLKRSHALDVQYSELYLQESESAKRFKWTELTSPFAIKNEFSEMNCSVGKKRKLVT